MMMMMMMMMWMMNTIMIMIMVMMRKIKMRGVGALSYFQILGEFGFNVQITIKSTIDHS